MKQFTATTLPAVRRDVSEDLLAGRGGNRLAWEDVPRSVRAQVAAWLGGEISHVETRPGGFSPGVAGVLVTVDGRRFFVKAAGRFPNDTAPRIHRREITIARRLPAQPSVPRLLWSLDDEQTGWVVLLFQELHGAPPRVPWQRGELERVLRGLATLMDTLTPSPLPLEVSGDLRESALLGEYWSRLAAEPAGLDDWSRRHCERLADLERQAPSVLAGDTLLHLDIRADNVLLTPDSVAFVDWPHARQGAAWVDLVCFAPSVAMQGGPRPDEVLALYPGTLPDTAALLCALTAISGYFTWGALQSPPPGLPNLRAFQDAQGRVARRWLSERLGATRNAT